MSTVTTKPTGNAGTMKIEDDGSLYVDFWLLGVNQVVDQIPWTYTLDGVVSGLRSFRLEANVAWQKVTTLQITAAQAVTFSIGNSGNVLVGGPTDFTVDIARPFVVTGSGGTTRVKVGDLYHDAIGFVNDQGTWKQIVPFVRIAGEWKAAY